MAIIKFDFRSVVGMGAGTYLSQFFEKINKKSLPLIELGKEKPFIADAAVWRVLYSNGIELTSAPLETQKIVTNAYVGTPASLVIELIQEDGDTFKKLDDAMRAGTLFSFIHRSELAITPVVITDVKDTTAQNSLTKGNIIIELAEIELASRN